MAKRNKKRIRKQNPSTKPKVSEMIQKFAADFINMGETQEEKQNYLNTAVSAWNISLHEGQKRNDMLEQYLDLFRSYNKNLDENDVQDVRDNMEKLIAEKERLFPNEKRFIISAEITPDNHIIAASGKTK